MSFGYRAAMTQRTRWVPGLVFNGLALALAVCSMPALALPTMKLAFAGAVMALPVALLVAVIGFLVVLVGPVVGLVQAARGVRAV